MHPAKMIEIWRGGRCESRHSGHAVVCDRTGVIEAWGVPDAEIYPRSSCKMVQALPLIESGAADDAGLGTRQLALACASHNGAAIHVEGVRDWLDTLGMGESDLRCGCHMPNDQDEKYRLIRSDNQPDQFHNNCSGKHAGFLTLNRRLGGDSEYISPDHPVQMAVKTAFEETAGEISPGYGIDGCSAPNHACTLKGLATSMAAFANPGSDLRGQAMRRLVEAMCAHPELVAGEGRACTSLMRAMGGNVAVKTGAEGVFVAILPEQGLGVAVKAVDGATRASEAAITAILVHLGVLDRNAPVVSDLLSGPMRNWRKLEVGEMRTARGFPE